MSKGALRLIVGLETARDVWKCLEHTYAGDSQAQEFQLLQQIQLFEKKDAYLADYINKFKGICDDLAEIGKPVADQNKVFWLLQGLGPKYESFTTSMLKPPIPSYSDVIPILQSHEIRNQSHDFSFPNQNVALRQQRSNGNNRNNKGNWQEQGQFNSNGPGFIQAAQSGQRAPSPEPARKKQGMFPTRS